MSLAFTAKIDDLKSYVSMNGAAGTLNMIRHDDAVEAGFWRVKPEDMEGPYEAVFDRNEVVYIIEGHVRVVVDDKETYDLKKGDSASFVKGTKGHWTVLEPTVELFIYA